MNSSESESTTDHVAIIGMAGRFPGARNIEQFWKNLRDGVESISFFSDEELIRSGIDPFRFVDQHYVKAAGVVPDAEYFDAQFFGFTDREAQITDPQQRLLLECAWEALESAGYDPERYRGQIGVFAGASTNKYRSLIRAQRDLFESLNPLQIRIGNDKDFLCTRVSYKLNLRGPSLNLYTACSTSLVAAHLACQSLLHGECDIALAGGVCISVPQVSGYVYQEGGIDSADGHCRPFDEQARGTVSGNGVGMVVLKRLSDALSDGDVVCAVIKGSAINNDGADKIGFTAPGIEGQARVIAEALAVAEVPADSISYIEAHGTATPLGDPIEIAALNKAFRRGTKRSAFCAVGSVKSNVGHLDAAAGVTGLIKTVLALQRRELPPSLHFKQPNSKIDFQNSPFFVNARLSPWSAGDTPRRAGVSSFGIGGTNAHVVLEEAPASVASGPETRPWQPLLLSARTESALDQMSLNLLSFLKGQPESSFADIAFTLAVGRKAFEYRRLLVCRDRTDAISSLEENAPGRFPIVARRPSEPACVFMFPGHGVERVNMLRDLYESELAFREQINVCSELLKLHLELDLRDVLYPAADRLENATAQMTTTTLSHPALFVVEYSLAKLLMKWGVKPTALIGHSLGEYVAACLAGVFTLAEGLDIVTTRARLMQQLPAGAMLAAPLSDNELQSLFGSHPKVSLAADNCSSQRVVSGSLADIEAVESELKEHGYECQRLLAARAFHSPAMSSMDAPLIEKMRKMRLQRPKLPFVSNLTGRFITDDEATDPRYWAEHLQHTVRFAEGAGLLLDESNAILLEVGPRKTLSTFVRQHPSVSAEHLICNALGESTTSASNLFELPQTLGRLWQEGVKVNWSEFYAGQNRQRVMLPTYPFERRRYWVESPSLPGEAGIEPAVAPIRPVAVSVTADHRSANGVAIDSWTEQMISQQLQLMSEQLELLQDPYCVTGSNAEVPTLFAGNGKGPRVQAEPREMDLVEDLLQVPLTPVQHKFFEHSLLHPSHWNQSRLLQINERVEPALLETSIRHLVACHDALRLRFVKEGSEWRQQLLRALPEPLLEQFDLSKVPEPDRENALALVAQQLQRSLNLTAGQLVRFVLVGMGNDQPQLLLMIIHHLIVDDMSWGILIKDLELQYGCLRGSHEVPLAPAPTSFRQWAGQLFAHAQTSSLVDELAYWRQELQGPTIGVPRDISAGENTEESGQTIVTRLSEKETSLLLRCISERHAMLSDALIMGMAHAFAAWTKGYPLLIEVEGHGRESLFPELDLSRTVGWFTSLYPLRLELPNQERMIAALSLIKERMRRIPNGGIGYGLLRYLTSNAGIREQLRATPQAEISYNHLGQLRSKGAYALFKPLAESSLSHRSEQGLRFYLLDISSSVWQGQLRVAWRYSRNIHHGATIQSVADATLGALRALIDEDRESQLSSRSDRQAQLERYSAPV